MTEAELREEYQDKIRKATFETLPELMAEIMQQGDDYGTICVATGLCAAAAAWACNNHPNGHLTGFQAGAISWEFLRHWGALYPRGGGRMQDYEDLLFPQNASTFTSISQETADALKEKAAKKLAEKAQAHPDVVAHWERLAAGEIPFGLNVERGRSTP